MPLGNMGGWTFIIILLVILLLFGAAKLPALAKGLGQSARIFKREVKAMKEEDAESSPAADVQSDVPGPALSHQANSEKPSAT